MPKYSNKEFRKLVEFINEGREDKSKKIYEDKGKSACH